MLGMPEPVMMPHELRFDPPRDWLFDFAWPELPLKMAVEYHGSNSHRTTRFDTDRAKMNHASILGWLVIEITPSMLASGKAEGYIADAYQQRAGITRSDIPTQRFLTERERWNVMSFFEVAGEGGKIPPVGRYFGTLTKVEIKPQPSFDNPEIMVNRACFTLTTTTKDPETDTPYVYYEWTGVKYGNSKARLTELLDQMFPAMTTTQRSCLMPEHMIGKKFEFYLVKYTKQNNKEGVKMALIAPYGPKATASAPAPPPPTDEEFEADDPFADE